MIILTFYIVIPSAITLQCEIRQKSYRIQCKMPMMSLHCYTIREVVSSHPICFPTFIWLCHCYRTVCLIHWSACPWLTIVIYVLSKRSWKGMKTEDFGWVSYSIVWRKVWTVRWYVPLGNQSGWTAKQHRWMHVSELPSQSSRLNIQSYNSGIKSTQTTCSQREGHNALTAHI